MKILMVCLGNICRSPLAEGILKSKVSENVYVDSAGTAAYHVGELPDKRSISVAKKYGIDLNLRQFYLKLAALFARLHYFLITIKYSDNYFGPLHRSNRKLQNLLR